MKMKKLSAIVLASLLALSIATSCGSSDAQSNQGSSSSASDTAVSGSITLSGSTSMEKLCNAMNAAFSQKYPQAQAQAQFTGSSAGIEAVLAGTSDIGNSSRALKDEEKQQGAVENIVAIDGIAVIVNTENKVEDLTTEQLIKIYTGEITNWKDVGGDDKPITVIGREAGSGTRGAFEELLEVEEKCKYAQEIDSTGAVVAKVTSTPDAIGYVSLDVIDDTVKPVKLDGVAPSEETIKSGDYTLARPFVMATKGEISEQSDVVKAYFDFIKSEEGQKIITSVGLIIPEDK